MFGVLNESEIEDVLHNSVVGRIGCHADAVTYVVPVSYAYDGTNVYVHTLEGMKLSIMRKNPNVCFQADSMPTMANWKSVIAWGEFEELTDEGARALAVKKLLARRLPLASSETTHLSQTWPFTPEDLTDIKGIVFRIRLTRKTGRFEKDEKSAR